MNSIMRNVLSIIAFLLISNPLSANPCASGNNVSAGFQLKSSSIALGSGLGASGLHTFDSNQNGLNEIIFGTGFGGNTSFVVAEYNRVSKGFDLLCQSEPYGLGISVISPFSNNSISAGSLVASGGNIEVIDHTTGSKVRLIQTSLSDIEDVTVGDIDNDGKAEIAVLSTNVIAIYDANTYAFEQSLNYGGQAFALGHFTTKTKTQIAINTGYVFELNGEALSTVWNYSVIGFSNRHLKAGDIDNDGLDEIVGADGWYNMRVFNADNKGVLWEHSAELDIDAVAVYDATGDGVPEVIYGDGQWGNIYALSGHNGAQLWSVANPGTGTTDVLIAELDGDASLELVWGAGIGFTGSDHLFIHDIGSGTRQWQSPDGGEVGVTAVSFGLLNSDTIPDRIVASFKSQDGDGILTAYNGATNEILWRTAASTFDSFAATGIHDVTIGDINGDGTSEVLVATDRLYDGRVYVLDAASGTVTGSVALESGSPIYSVRIADIDGDGDMEILAGGGKEHTGANGVYVYVIDGSTLKRTKTLPSLGNVWTDLWAMDIADIDQDNHQEVIGLLSDAYIIDPDNNGLLRTSSETASSLAVSTDALDGDPVVYIGGKTGVLSRLAADASLTPVNSLCDNDIVALEAISPVKLAFVCNGTLGIYDVVAGSVAWVTNQRFDGNLGNYDRLKVEKVNGKIQMLVGGSSGYLFEELEAGSSDNILNIQVRGLLQGAYDAGSKLMHQRLAERQVLPLKQPYSNLFAYSGNETLASSLMGAGMMGNAAVDWVLVELRDADNPANRVFSSAAILQRDGDVAEPRSNLTTLAIPNMDAGAYYVSLRHRNHLGVMTAEPVTLSATPTLIDFSNPVTKVFGTHARKKVGSASLMWSGDVNKDNNVIGAGSNNDSNSILSSVLTYPTNKTANTNFILPGYYVSDLNMDGRTIYSGPNNDADLVLSNVLLHPGNTQFASNFIIRGSLP